MSGSEVYYSLKHGSRLSRPVGCPLSMYQIMLLCWKWDENQRPTFYQLVRLIKREFIDRHLNKTYRRSISVVDEIHGEKENTFVNAEQELKKIIQF